MRAGYLHNGSAYSGGGRLRTILSESGFVGGVGCWRTIERNLRLGEKADADWGRGQLGLSEDKSARWRVMLWN